MKKIVSLTLMLLCFAIGVQAQVSYGISICGREVTSDNKDNIMGDGKVSYKNGVLYLMSGADLTVSGPNYGIEVEDRYESTSLNIFLMGDANIQSYADCIHLTKNVKLTLLGSHTLTMNSTAANGLYAESEGDILFTTGITVNCTANNGVAFYHNPKEAGNLRFAEMRTATIYGGKGAIMGFNNVTYYANYLKDDYYVYDEVNREMQDNKRHTATEVNIGYGYGVSIFGHELTPENIDALSGDYTYEEGNGLYPSPQLTIHQYTNGGIHAPSEAPFIELHRNCDEFIIHIDGNVSIDGRGKSSHFILSKGDCTLQITGTRYNTLHVRNFKLGIEHCFDRTLSVKIPFDNTLCIRKLFMDLDLGNRGCGISTSSRIYFDTCNINISNCAFYALTADSYDFDEAEIVLPVRAIYTKGAVWLPDGKTQAQNVVISSDESFKVIVGNTFVDYKNYLDVFQDRTVRYDPDCHTLYLNNATIDGGISSYDKIKIVCSGYNEIATEDVGYYNSTDSFQDEYATDIQFAGKDAELHIISRDSKGVLAERGGLRVGPGGLLEVQSKESGISGENGRNNKLLLDGANVKISFTDWEEKTWRTWITTFDDVIFQDCRVEQPVGAYYNTKSKNMVNADGNTQNTQLVIGYYETPEAVLEFDITGGEVVYNGAPNYDWSYKFVAPYEGYNLEFFFNIPNQPAAGIKPELTFNLEDMDADKTYLRNTYNGATATFSSVSFTAYEGTDFTIYEAEMVLYDQSVGFKLHCVVYDDEDPLATGITAPSVSSLHTGRAWGGSPAYNLNGQRVSDSYKGMVIKNGRKYRPSK